MAAALGVIDYVVITEETAALEALTAALEPDAVARFDAAHQRRFGQLIDHVRRRHHSGLG